MDEPIEDAFDEAEDEEDEDDVGEPVEPRFPRLRAFFQKYRRRMATGAIVVFLAAVGLEVGNAYPRTVEISLPLGAQHARLQSVDVTYAQEGEAVRMITRRFAEGAPAELRDSVELSPGEYDVQVLLVDREGHAEELSGQISAPSDGVVRVALSSGRRARRGS